MVERLLPVRPWFAARIKRNAFSQAERGLRSCGINVFAPKLERHIVRYGKRRLLKSLMFPGYIFVDGSDQQQLWAAVRSTYGLARLVLSGTREPAQVPSDFIGELLARCDETGSIVAGEELNEGDRVRIVAGPLSGLVTRIQQVDEQQRVWILLDLLGGDRRIAAKREHLAKLAG